MVKMIINHLASWTLYQCWAVPCNCMHKVLILGSSAYVHESIRLPSLLSHTPGNVTIHSWQTTFPSSSHIWNRSLLYPKKLHKKKKPSVRQSSFVFANLKYHPFTAFGIQLKINLVCLSWVLQAFKEVLFLWIAPV